VSYRDRTEFSHQARTIAAIGPSACSYAARSQPEPIDRVVRALRSDTDLITLYLIDP